VCVIQNEDFTEEKILLIAKAIEEIFAEIHVEVKEENQCII
jgi:hypothetical protein